MNVHFDIRFCALPRRVVAKRRTLELASHGYTTFDVPKPIKKKIPFFNRRNRATEYVSATLFLMKSLKEEKDSRYCMEFKMNHDAKMAEQRLLREECVSACLSMNKVLQEQPQYIHIVRRIAAIEALQYNLANGLIQPKNVASNLKAIMSVPLQNDGPRVSESDFEGVLDELEHGNFFPVLDFSTGKISFTDCYEEISKWRDDDEYDLAAKNTTITFRSYREELARSYREELARSSRDELARSSRDELARSSRDELARSYREELAKQASATSVCSSTLSSESLELQEEEFVESV